MLLFGYASGAEPAVLLLGWHDYFDTNPVIPVIAAVATDHGGTVVRAPALGTDPDFVAVLILGLTKSKLKETPSRCVHKANIVKMTPANVAPTVSVMRVMVGGSSGSTGGGGAAGTAGADILVAYFLGEFFGGLPFLRPRIGGLDFVAVS